MARNTKATRVSTTTYIPTMVAGIDMATTEKGATYARISVGRWSVNISAAHLDIILANADMIRSIAGSVPAPAPLPVAPAPAPTLAAAIAPAPLPVAPAPTGKIPITPSMLKDAKELHVKAVHLYKNGAKLQAAIDAKLATMGKRHGYKPTQAVPVPTPTITLANPTASSPAPLRVERHPAGPKLLTIALGEDGNMYTIMVDPITGKLTANVQTESAVA
jgi:hypothetical protein